MKLNVLEEAIKLRKEIEEKGKELDIFNTPTRPLKSLVITFSDDVSGNKNQQSIHVKEEFRDSTFFLIKKMYEDQYEEAQRKFRRL